MIPPNTPAVYTPPGAPAPVAHEHALAPSTAAVVRMGMDTVAGFEALQRAAKMLASASNIPNTYQNKVGDCAVALDIALRLGMSPLLVMQNLYVVQGKPSWAGQFAIAVVNNSRTFSPLDFEWRGVEGTRDRACRAVATRLSDRKACHGTWITWDMVDKEGWASKQGSKWLSMPEQMFTYRAASFWLRRFYPEGLLGLPTEDEVIDITPAKPAAVVELHREAPAAPAAPAGALEPGVDPVSMGAPTPPPAPATEPPKAPPAKKGLEATKERIRQAKERLAAATPVAAAPNDPPDDELGRQRTFPVEDNVGEG